MNGCADARTLALTRYLRPELRPEAPLIVRYTEPAALLMGGIVHGGCMFRRDIQSLAAGLTGVAVRGEWLVGWLPETALAWVSGMQSGLVPFASACTVVKELTGRKLASVELGAVLCLAVPFVLPVLSLLGSSIRRRVRARQRQCQNDRAIFRARIQQARIQQGANLGDAVQSPAGILRSHARQLKWVGSVQKALSARGARTRTAVTCLLAVAPPVAVFPRLAALTGVSAAVPVVLGLAAAGCGTCLVTSYLDNRQARAQAQALIGEGERFERLAQEAGTDMRPQAVQAGASGDAENRAEA